MMKKYQNIILGCLVLLTALMTACTSDADSAKADESVASTGKVTITGTVEFPDMEQALTRSLDDYPAAGTLSDVLLHPGVGDNAFGLYLDDAGLSFLSYVLYAHATTRGIFEGISCSLCTSCA